MKRKLFLAKPSYGSWFSYGRMFFIGVGGPQTARHSGWFSGEGTHGEK